MCMLQPKIKWPDSKFKNLAQSINKKNQIYESKKWSNHLQNERLWQLTQKMKINSPFRNFIIPSVSLPIRSYLIDLTDVNISILILCKIHQSLTWREIQSFVNITDISKPHTICLHYSLKCSFAYLSTRSNWWDHFPNFTLMCVTSFIWAFWDQVLYSYHSKDDLKSNRLSDILMFDNFRYMQSWYIFTF